MPNCEILVFEQKDNPDAGLQVPGGTIENDELIDRCTYTEKLKKKRVLHAKILS